MNIKVGHANLFRYGSRNMQNANSYGNLKNPANDTNALKTDRNADPLKRMLSAGKRAEQGMPYSSSITEGTFSYADSIRESRMKAKDTSLKLKKLHYDFKSISSQILRSKTSASARQVVGAARREVMRLKRQRQDSEYDDEELQSAIAHAEAMERVAKKKMRHLLEEEMVKVTGGPCAGELEEKEDQKEAAVDEAANEQEALREQMPENEMIAARDGMDEAMQAQMQAYREVAEQQQEEMREMMQLQMEELQRAMEERTEELQMENSASMEDMMSEMMDEMSDAMKEMLEDMGLEDLADSMFATAETEMDPADYKMMKLKHRSEEMKAIAKADAEYMKALFDRLEKMKGSSMGAVLGTNGNAAAFGGLSMGGGVIAVSGGSPTPMPEIDVASVPGSADVPAPEAGGIDISV